jgi:hypothetical protein
MGHREGGERERDADQGIADRGDALADPEQAEVALREGRKGGGKLHKLIFPE